MTDASDNTVIASLNAFPPPDQQENASMHLGNMLTNYTSTQMNISTNLLEGLNSVLDYRVNMIGYITPSGELNRLNHQLQGICTPIMDHRVMLILSVMTIKITC